MDESALKGKILALLRGIMNSRWEKVPVSGAMSLPVGTPDILGVWAGQAWFIELKVGNRFVDIKQRFELLQWAKAGAKSFVFRLDSIFLEMYRVCSYADSVRLTKCVSQSPLLDTSSANLAVELLSISCTSMGIVLPQEQYLSEKKELFHV